MSQHFVTVCVVCVLCAAHAPCSAHTGVSVSSSSSSSSGSPGSSSSSSSSPSSSSSSSERDGRDISETGGGESRLDILKSEIRSRELVRLKNSDKFFSIEKSEADAGARPRKKRNFDYELDGKYFTKRIFNAYGNGDSITIEGFERLLKKLGIDDVINKLDNDLDKDYERDSINEDRIDTVDFSINKMNNTEEDEMNGKASEKSIKKEKCLGSKELLGRFYGEAKQLSETDNSTTLPDWLFERVCPAIVYQLATSEANGCFKFPDHFNKSDDIIDSDKISQHTWQVWIWSSLSILVISLCGLLGVVVIPVMNKSYYHQMIQFLVALAVGTLCGDALIHLLPHAMMSASHSHSHGHSHDSNNDYNDDSEHDHDMNMWKGLVAMMGLVLFFFTEKALTMIAEWRKSRQRRNKLPLRVKVMREPADNNTGSDCGSGGVGGTSGDKHCKHKYSSYPYCYGEITTETQDNHHINHQNTTIPGCPSGGGGGAAAIVEEEKPLTVSSNCKLSSKSNYDNVDNKKHGDHDDDDDDDYDDEWKINDVDNKKKKNNDIAADNQGVINNDAESYTVIIREHETKHHGHTHSHGHVHSAPESMSSVAWMVIMGDGLHNFTDGMAIGAAFAANIPGGFSTAIAVLCHELPHELGDFAVLLKAGMSAKQAVFYNLLSSVLCLFGMIFGILLGEKPSATSWIFAAAAGMFIYIALVDMIPELTSSHSAEGGSQWQCLLQALGLATGLGIMLIIALYEHDLKQIFPN